MMTMGPPHLGQGWSGRLGSSGLSGFIKIVWIQTETGISRASKFEQLVGPIGRHKIS
jgi:hypothetical protein